MGTTHADFCYGPVPCTRPLTRRREAPLRREQLHLRSPAIELALSQHHRRARDLLRPMNRAGIFVRTRRRLQCATSLLERALGVLRVFARLESAEPVLKLSCLRGRIGLARGAMTANRKTNERDQNEARDACSYVIIDR